MFYWVLLMDLSFIQSFFCNAFIPWLFSFYLMLFPENPAMRKKSTLLPHDVCPLPKQSVCIFFSRFSQVKFFLSQRWNDDFSYGTKKSVKVIGHRQSKVVQGKGDVKTGRLYLQPNKQAARSWSLWWEEESRYWKVNNVQICSSVSKDSHTIITC